jgi:hypothetical protein
MNGVQRVALLVAAVVLATTAAAVAGTRHPRVRLSDRAPATVAGAYFRPAERVTVTVSTGGLVLRKTVAAGTTGSFTARWRRALPETCSALAVTAVGSAGSRAVYKVVPDCAPPVGQ